MENKENIPESNRIRLERKTIEKMIYLFCRNKHNSNGILCDDCNQLNDYASLRLLNCPFKEEKPVCSDCTIHCYKPDMRERVKEVMRYSGPKMIFKHPYLAIMHLIYEKS
ncbi:MAG: nitrous oxide-stimulated promoter family protein [Ignavibacteria bacterium]